MLQAGGCEELRYGDRHCPGARELSSAHSVVSLYEDSTQGGLERKDNVNYAYYTTCLS